MNNNMEQFNELESIDEQSTLEIFDTDFSVDTIVNDVVDTPVNTVNTLIHPIKEKTEEDILPEFMENMFNNYLSFYKETNNDIHTLFDGINLSDPSSTNKQLEMFYQDMCEFKENNIESSSFTTIFNYDERNKIDTSNDDDLYCIMKNGKAIKCSQSFFSILIELTNLQYEHGECDVHFQIIKIS
jgi:hypothetical protein